MTIQDWGSIGELLSAVAVVITLGYLATQIRFARLAASDASRQSRANGVREMELEMLHNSELRRAWHESWRKTNPEIEAIWEDLGRELTLDADQTRIVWHQCSAWAWTHWGQFRSMKSNEDRRELEHIVSEFYSNGPMGVVWQHELLRDYVDPDFVVWVDGILNR
jgi:hypothetical protein